MSYPNGRIIATNDGSLSQFLFSPFLGRTFRPLLVHDQTKSEK